MNELPFTKMHGLGNCFILMDDRQGNISDKADPHDLAIGVCDRNFGIGADGLILVNNSSEADFKMRIFNEDGSEPEMCGNGIRCFVRYLVDEGISHKRDLEVETLAGLISTTLDNKNNVRVDMGEPVLSNDDVIADSGNTPITVLESKHEFTFVSMGNPHAIAFVDSLNFDWRAVGVSVEKALSFPNKTNVEFVKVLGPREAEVKVWERGCGETAACGTGACAVTVAGALLGHLSREPVVVHLPGGPLEIHWNEASRVMMTGPTAKVCKGVYWFSE
ncbi:MAG: diaminopimelate epimerase [Proteobacteria bacterium]|nr:diaminopimelate epimerase [Pseudomonadota bacterium]